MQAIFNGARLRALAKERGYTVEMIAEKLGLSPNAVYQYLLGNRNPNLANFVLLAEMMGVEMDELIIKDNPGRQKDHDK